MASETVVKGSNRVRGQKNYIHPPLTDKDVYPAHGPAVPASKSTGAASFKGATTSKSIKGKK